MEFFLLIIRLLLAVIFLAAGIGKLLDPEGSKKALKDFGVSEPLAKPFSIILPLTEILLAVLLLFTETSWLAAASASLLLLVFIGAMLYQLKQGNAPDCHCFGQIYSEPVGKKSLLRNGIFALFALFLVFSGRQNQGLNLFDSSLDSIGKTDFMQTVIGAAIVVLLAAIVYFLKQISAQQVQILRRIEVLEIISGGGGKELAAERGNIGHPEDGLPLGAPAPDFLLPDADGKLIAFEHLLMRVKPLIFFFVSPNCNPCSALLPEIKTWRENLGEKFDFVFISSGKTKENSEKFGESGARILLQKDREVASVFGTLWTPAALLVNSDGTIGSRTAAGDKAIRDLMETVEKESAEKDLFYIANGEGGARKSKIGETVPDFELEDLTGKRIGAEDFRERKTLVVFWSLNCPHCRNMIEELREWEKAKGENEPRLIVFSDGDRETHKTLELNSPFVLDEDYKIASRFGMSGTPSAVLVNENGEFISETAIGAPQIWALLGKKK